MDFELKIETPLPINQQIEKFLRKQIQQAQGDENSHFNVAKEPNDVFFRIRSAYLR